MKFELDILKKIQGLHSPLLDVLFETITFFGEEIIIIIVLAFIYFTYDKRLGEKIVFSVFGSILFNNLLKGIFLHERPFQMYPDEIKPLREQTATGASFPSGHTQNAATFYTTLSLHIRKKWFWITSTALIVLIGFSRLYLGVHFPKDVVVGGIVGVVWSFLGWNLYQKYARDKSSKIILFTLQLLIFTPFLFFKESRNLPIKIGEDFFKIYFVYLGFLLAIIVENKYVNFSYEINQIQKALRFLIAIILLAGLMFGLKAILPTTLFFVSLRYFLISFITIGLFPLSFKALKLD